MKTTEKNSRAGSMKSWSPDQPHPARAVATEEERADEEALEDRLHEFRFYLLRNVRYHSRRATFFSQWHRLTAFVGVFFGSSAAVTFLVADSPVAASTLAAIVALFSAIDLVVGTANKEAMHLDLRRRWVALQRRFEAEGLNHDIVLERRTIEMDELPELPIVELQAYNDASLSLLGKDAHPHLITFKLYQKLLGQFISIDTTGLHKAADEKAAQPA